MNPRKLVMSKGLVIRAGGVKEHARALAAWKLIPRSVMIFPRARSDVTRQHGRLHDR